MPTAVVTVSGLVNGVTTSATPVITPGGSPDAGSQLLQWEAELISDTAREPLAKGTGTLFRPWDPQVALAQGANYTVRVRVQDISWAWSPWATVRFKVAPITPPNPTISVIGGKHPTTGAPRAELGIKWPATGYNYNQRILVDVQRSDAAYGWITFHQRYMTPGQLLMAVDDYGCPNGVPVSYRVRPTIWNSGGQPVIGGWTTSQEFTLNAKRVSGFIVDPSHPELSVRVVMTEREDRNWRTMASATDLISPAPISVWGGRGHNNARMSPRVSTGLPSLPTGKITARCDDRETFEKALRILSTGSLLLFRGHREIDYKGYVANEPDLWFRTVDAVVEKDLVEYAHRARVIEWSWVGQHPEGVSGQ